MKQDKRNLIMYLTRLLFGRSSKKKNCLASEKNSSANENLCCHWKSLGAVWFVRSTTKDTYFAA